MPKGSQVRVIDPILSNHAAGYRHPDHIGHNLFPVVPVQANGGQRIEFGKESFKLYNTRRAPGTETKRVRYGYTGKPFALEHHSLDAVVPREHLKDAEQVPGINLAAGSVNLTLRSISLGYENDAAAIARDASLYDANHKQLIAGTDLWTDGASKPLVQLKDSIESVRRSIGTRPNVVEVPAAAMHVLEEHATITDRLKYTGRDSLTAEMLAHLLNVKKVVIGEAITFDDAGDAIDVWGNDVVIAYVPEGAQTIEEPSYGYTYQMEGHPMVEEAYYDKAIKSWVYGVTLDRAPVLTGITAGFLLQNVIN